FDHGIPQIIPPLPSANGALITTLDAYNLILYPYIEGENAFIAPLTDQHWIEFGAAIKKLHTIALPPALRAQLPRQTYSPQFRDTVKPSLASLDTLPLPDAVAVDATSFLRANQTEILELITRAESYVPHLLPLSAQFVPCHTDLHRGNLYLSAANNQ